MKIHTLIKRVPACLMAAVLTAIGAATAVHAAAPALQAQIVLRPLSPQDIKDYGLTGLQGASGLSTVGVGQPAYLEVLINAAIAPSNIVSVTWTLTGKPMGSLAQLEDSPLGTNVPTYKIADRINQNGANVYQVAGRKMLRPDKTGVFDEQYTVEATVVTVGSGMATLTQKITAGTYLGINACSVCHNGSPGIPAKVEEWSQTPHATFFTRAIDGLESDHYGKNCISCHTVGYDANTNAVNGGFDDVAKSLNWVFPTNLVVGNWANLTNKLQNLANIQCENCHGPGSQHAYYLGNTNLISKTFAAGDCAQCHDSKPNHSRTAEWNNSLHARVTRTPSGAGREACVRCHTAAGFTAWAEAGGMETQNQHPTSLDYVPSTVYEAITCQTCHDPHNAENPHQLRLPGEVTLSEGTVVTDAGSGAFCMQCHNSRNGSVTNSIVKYPASEKTWVGGSAFGVHDSPQADMLEGVNAVTYGKFIPSAAHAHSIENTCAGCHMQPVASSDPAFTLAGGHTFKMSYEDGMGEEVDKVDVCVKCHGPITSFDMVKADFDGDGVIDGVQTEVQHLLDKLSTLLPPRNNPNSPSANPASYVADGKVKTSFATYTNVPTKFLQAAYNYGFVSADGSKGIHNAPYAVGLLKASIADLTGDANNDGIADAWQEQYFGSNWVNDPKSAPNATPAGDIYPNWLKYALGLDPNVAGIAVPDGVIWANAGSTGGDVNTVHIYTAAEIVFDTEVGKTYQIQGISSLGGGWQNIGDPIIGDGNSRSYVTPTRSGAQQFYRVAHSE